MSPPLTGGASGSSGPVLESPITARGSVSREVAADVVPPQSDPAADGGNAPMYPSVQGPKKIVTMSASGEPIISEIPGSASDITVHDNQDPPSLPDESMPTPTEAGDDPLIPDPPVPMEGIPEVPTVPIDEEGARPAPQAEAAPAMEQDIVIGDAPEIGRAHV